MTEDVLSLRELNRALLARQLLLERRKLGVQKAVETLCAIQAQWPQSPYIALWTRLAGFRKEQLTRAVEQHKVVKATLDGPMRRMDLISQSLSTLAVSAV